MLASDSTAFEVSEVLMTRLIVCGQCPRSGIDPKMAQAAFRGGVSRLIAKLARFDEWGPDTERAEHRRKVGSAAYRESHRDHIRAMAEEARIEARIRQLEEGGPNV